MNSTTYPIKALSCLGRSPRGVTQLATACTPRQSDVTRSDRYRGVSTSVRSPRFNSRRSLPEPHIRHANSSITSHIQRRHLRVEATSDSSSSSSTSPPFNNLTYYTFGTPNGLKPAIVLEELGLPYKAVTVDISKNVQKEPWFLEINPNGRIPALKDGNLRVFETGAIMLYLLDHYDPDKKLGFTFGTSDYYEMLSWLMWQMGGLGPMQGQANHFSAMAGVYSAYGIQRYTDETKRLISVLESQLSQTEYLVADKYTVADIASFSWVRGAPLLLDIELDPWPGVKKWCEKIEERDAVQRALKVPSGSKTREELMEMFRGMREEVRRKAGTDNQNSKKEGDGS